LNVYCKLQERNAPFSKFLYTGGVVGPVLFGLVIDRSCVLWEKKCDGSTGACLYYDNHQMGWLLFAVCAVCMVLNNVCGLISWQLYMRRLRKGHVPQSKLEVGPTVDNDGSTADVVAEDRVSGISNSALNEETSKL